MPKEPVQTRDEFVLALTLREAAERLGITTDELEMTVKRRKVKSLVAGWAMGAPTSEVETPSRLHLSPR